MNNNDRDREIFLLNETDLQYLSAEDFEPDPKLVQLFNSKSPWESDNAFGDRRS